jgi:ribonuclease HI
MLLSENVSLRTEEEPVVGVKQGFICFTDGGCRQGYGGWGIHGYLFVREKPKQQPTLPDFVATTTGYVNKLEYKNWMAEHPKEKIYGDEVYPTTYFDGFGTFQSLVTNNVAEIMSATKALKLALKYNVDSIQLFSDSTYVRDGFENFAVEARANNWMKYDGSDKIPNAVYWKELLELKDAFFSRGVEITITWVKGHADNWGNRKADFLATIGVMHSKIRDYREEIDECDAKERWKIEVNKHPFLNLRRLWFNTLPTHNTPGEYYTTELSDAEETPGKKISDGVCSVVRLGNPEPLIEDIRNHHVKLADGLDLLIKFRLDKLFESEAYHLLSRYGTMAVIQPNPKRLDTEVLDKQPLTREETPVGLAMRTVDELTQLINKLNQFISKHEMLIETDLTPIIYETTVKVNKKGEFTTEFKLKPEFNVGFAALPIKANFKSGSDTKSTSVTLTMGIDLLDRNSLKRLEEKDPKVSLITWLEAPNVFRYATVIKAGNDIGIWAAPYSNLVIVKDVE